MTTPTELSAINEALTYSGSEMNAEQIHAGNIVQLYVQDVAKGILEKKGVDIGNPALYRSKQWYDALIEATVKYADFVMITDAKDIQTHKSTYSGELKLGKIMADIISAYMGAAAASDWLDLTQLLAGNVGTGVTDFMNFWWSHVSINETDSGFSAGPTLVSTLDKEIEYSFVYYVYTFKLSDWRALFVSSHYESFDVYSTGMTFKFDMTEYEKVSKELNKKLTGKVKSSIKNAPLG